jgi:hypothetical protein
MLILGIISTGIAIYSAVYLPGLKPQSEIEQSRQVADAFVRIDSAIDSAMSQKKATRFRETLPLGGGSVLLSPVRSSGTISIQKDELFSMIVTNDSETKRWEISTVDISYVPSFTTWEPQGYRWESGFIAVTKEDMAVPLTSHYNTIDEAIEGNLVFFRSFVDIDENSGELTISLINLTHNPGFSYITGNGLATIRVNTTSTREERKDVTSLLLIDDADMGSNLERICTQLSHRAEYTHFGDTYTLEFSTPVEIAIQLNTVEVSVW